jgi:hypothetical protein
MPRTRPGNQGRVTGHSVTHTQHSTTTKTRLLFHPTEINVENSLLHSRLPYPARASAGEDLAATPTPELGLDVLEVSLPDQSEAQSVGSSSPANLPLHSHQ